jgi:RHS repeat-associated protein
MDGSERLLKSTDSSGVTNYSYDDNGNQSLSVSPSGARTTSTWGYENQVGLVALPSGQLVTSTYNADNRRVSKANDDGMINFNWDPVNDNVILETDETNAVTAEYTNVPAPFGEPLSQNRNSVLSFFHFDGNYSTRQLTDISEVVTDTVIFTGYGEEVKHTGTIVIPFGYKGAVGYYTDSDTENIYVRARTYQPIIGRWLSMDPLEFVDGTSLYRAYFVPKGVDAEGTSFQAAQKRSRFSFCIERFLRLQAPLNGAGAWCLLRKIVVLKATQGSGWDNDKYAHCVASCRAAKDCGRYVSYLGGEAKELFDCLGGGTPDQTDLDANKDGRVCAGWESQFGAANVGVWTLTLLCRKTCHKCCIETKGHNPWRK